MQAKEHAREIDQQECCPEINKIILQNKIMAVKWI
jgi:hypothetical protein